MKKIDKIFKKWKTLATKDPDLIEELIEIECDRFKIFERFYKNLEFGTAGIRGIIGVGTNRMNVYTVGRITQAFCNHLKSFKSDNLVVIGFDNRIKSKLFAKVAAEVFSANEIKVKIFKELKPVPILSYAVRSFNCDGGVMITASHNSANYNGYKIYGKDGGQIVDEVFKKISLFIGQIDVFSVKFDNFNKCLKSGLISFCDDSVEQNFLCEVDRALIQPEILNGSDLKLIYTPLNGTGLEPIQRLLKKYKIESVFVVDQQKRPDGSFATCRNPNPELIEAFDLALKYCENLKPDVAIATDPDCDRVGVVVYNSCSGCYKKLNGNEIGVLMFDYICKQRLKFKNMPNQPVAIKTIVSTPMAEKIAQHYGVELIDVLTGFKYISEKVTELERYGEQARFIFGFEESQGYLAGSYVRDKDGVFAAMLICEIVLFYKKQNKTLFDVLEQLYQKFGYYKSALQSYVIDDEQGLEQMMKIMDYFRTSEVKQFGNFKVLVKTDYLASSKKNFDSGVVYSFDIKNLPKSNVIAFDLEGGLKILIRLSGTEPKLKIYYQVTGQDEVGVERSIRELKASFMQQLKQFQSPDKNFD